MSVQAGSVFAGYRIERMLGAGGMGTVYLARHPDLPRHEALKVLSAELSSDPEFRARFVREADVAAGLDHPNIVRVYRRGEYDGQLWIAMQFVDGTNAADAAGTRPMPAPHAVHIVTEVGKALDYAHHRGILHRDVKPANFLLSGTPGRDQRILLGDFGIARALGDTALTSAGSVLATLSYAAPEVLAGQPADARADLYSLGCTMFRLLTGTAPFAHADGMAALVAAHLQHPPPRVTDHAPWLSPQMNAVIATAMAKDPSYRYATAHQLTQAAAQALQDNPTPLHPQPQPPSRPLMGGTAPWQPTSTPPTMLAPTHYGPPPNLPPPPKRRTGRLAAIAATLVLLIAAITTTGLWYRHNHTPHESTAITTTTTTSPPPPSVADSALPGLLLPADKIADIVANSKIGLRNKRSTFDTSGQHLADKDKDCAAAWQPIQLLVYANTGWTAVAGQLLDDGDAKSMMVIQGLVSYPDAAAAQKVFADQTAKWQGCAGRSVVDNHDNQPPDVLVFGAMTTTDGTIAIRYSTQGTPLQGLRALAVRNNVVIDTHLYGLRLGNQAVDIANTIAAKVPQ